MFPNELIPLLMLYPEIHYRFRFFLFSNYFKKEPEILVDMPYKTIVGYQLPVFLIIKDAHKYPVEIINVKFSFRHSNRSTFQKIYDLNLKIKAPFFSKTFFFDFTGQTGFSKLTAEIEYKIRGKIRRVINDNFLLKEKRLSTFLNDNEELFNRTEQGDIHVHSAYTADQVEFGALPKDIKTAALAMNQHFTALTDHSYDLDDLENNYLINDPDLKKFKKMQTDCHKYSDNNFVMIKGEEITVRNSQDRNIHLLALDEDKFLEGKGDGAEQWLNRDSFFNVDEAVREVSKTTVMIAAHPLTPTPLLERFLIKRGEWQPSDLLNPAVKVWQIMNGEEDAGFIRGMNLWTNQLLSGSEKFIAAGNDSHGNFAAFRQIKLPMFSMIRAEKQLFGRWRTVVNTATKNVEAILQAISNGNSYITNGPHLQIRISNPKISSDDLQSDVTDLKSLGQTLVSASGEVICNLEVNSSLHSGKIILIKLFYGEIGTENEKMVDFAFEKQLHSYSFSKKISFNKNGYLRVEVYAESADRFGKHVLHKAFSNPIFIKRT